jgi:hypothetical protein
MLELDYPDDAEILAFATKHQLAPVDVLRDIARLVAIHQMATTKNYLNDNCVLCGGVAMRFYGSPRFTIMDTDASYRLETFDEIELERALTIKGEVEDLDISPGDGAYWERKNQLTTAQPVSFKQGFSTIQAPERLSKFKVTVSRRGLVEPAVWRRIRHEYSPMGLENTRVPLMAISEQLAEKIIGWSANGLLKHYLDAAWITHVGLFKKQDFEDLDRDIVIRCLEEKLAVARQREPRNYERFTTWRDFQAPLADGLQHRAPVGTNEDRGERLIRYVGQKVTSQDALKLVPQVLVPWLFGN